jgi:hypothetical protein
MQLKAGGRMRSGVCATEVMVILAPQGEVDLTCGGTAMVVLGTDPPAGATISAEAKDGTQIGKRYVNEAGDLELLCTKPGDGSLALGGAALTVKGAKPLPSSD